MIAIIDYGVGNLFSLGSSLNYLGIKSCVTNNKDEILNADRLILPGVGAFADARKKLAESGLDKLICEVAAKGKPLLGICLGMQLLFDKSFEYGEHSGLGLISGEVVPFSRYNLNLKIPQMGWNKLEIKEENLLTKNIAKDQYVYYVHSYFVDGDNKSVVAYSNYGVKVAGVVQNKNVFGTQFHPEKSGEVGLKILKAFNEV